MSDEKDSVGGSAKMRIDMRPFTGNYDAIEIGCWASRTLPPGTPSVSPERAQAWKEVWAEVEAQLMTQLQTFKKGVQELKRS